MQRILTASADTYICDKIINNSFRAADANVGHAGTLDLFKLYSESTISGTSNPIELSRILIKFNLDPLRALTGSILNLSSPNFKCFLNLRDVYGGQTTPSNFSLVVYPLSKSFDEGFGRDVRKFQDLDTANFLTASVSSGLSTWNVSGANGLGLLGSSNIDIIGSGTLPGSAGILDLGVTQVFRTGEEDLNVDVTRLVSASLVGAIPDCGFRISFSGSQETDSQTRFVKRFASRHAANVRNRPKLRVYFDDSIHDHHEDFFFDLSGSLFLNNFHRGTAANLVSGSSLIQLTGSNCIALTLMSGAFTSSYTGSQHNLGVAFSAGVYSATFAIPSNHVQLNTEIKNAGSATFTEVWSSLDRTVLFVSSTLVIKLPTRTSFDAEQPRRIFNVTNMRPTYKRSERARFRVYAQDAGIEGDFKLKKIPFELTSLIVDQLYYQIRDAHSSDIVIPFDRVYNSTLASVDGKGMFFDLFIDSLEPGRVYQVDLLVINNGVEEILTRVGGTFKVED